MHYRLRSYIVFFLTVIVVFATLEALGAIVHLVQGGTLQTLWASNRGDLILGLATEGIAAVILGLVARCWARIVQWLRRLLLPASRSQEEKLSGAEEAYLENVIARFEVEESWDTTKYTDLNAVFQDLELEWRYVKPRLWKLPGAEAVAPQTLVTPGRRVRLLPFLDKKQLVMLKGDPGTGKTLTLRRYAVSAAAAATRVPRWRRRLPLYVSLREYRGWTEDGQPQPVYDFLQAYIAAEYPGAVFLREHLTEYLDKGRLILLFDGVNEMPADDYVERLDQLVQFTHRQYPRNRAIYTCRTLHYTSSTEFETITITDLDDNRILQFLEAYLGAEAARVIFRELASGDRFMLRLCRNPFILRMLACLTPQRARVPQNRSELFEEFVLNRLAAAADPRFPQADAVLPFLRDLAFAMNQAGLFAGSVSEEWISQTITLGWPRNHLELAAAAQLTDRTADGRVRFYHQILQEYFAASELVGRFQDGEDVDEFLRDALWEETVILAAGLQGQPEPFLRRLWAPENGSVQNLWLAAKAMGASGRPVAPEYRESILGQLAGHLQLDEEQETDKEADTAGVIEGDFRQRLKRWMWGQKREKKQEAEAPEEAEEEDSLDLVAAVESTKTLGYIEDPESIDLLDRVIREHTGWIREVGIRVLGTMRGEAAHSALVEAVRAIAGPSTVRLVWAYLGPGERFDLLYRCIPAPIPIILGELVAAVVLTYLVGFVLKRFVYPQGIPERAARMAVVSICWSTSVLLLLSILHYLLREAMNRQLSIGRLIRAAHRYVLRHGLVNLGVRSLIWVLVLPALVIAMHVLGPMGTWLLVLGFQLLFVWALCIYSSREKGRRAVDGVLDPPVVLFLVFLLIAGDLLCLGWETTWRDINLEGIPSLSAFYWAHVAGLVLGILAVAGQIVILSWFFWCYLRATIKSLQMRRLSKLARQPATRNSAIQSLMSIAQDPSEWNRLRALAARHLRAVDLLPEHVERIRSIEAIEDSLVREMERTIYEQEARLREKRRRSGALTQ